MVLSNGTMSGQLILTLTRMIYYSSVYLCIPAVVATRMRARGKRVEFALCIRNFRVRARDYANARYRCAMRTRSRI